MSGSPDITTTSSASPPQYNNSTQATTNSQQIPQQNHHQSVGFGQTTATSITPPKTHTAATTLPCSVVGGHAATTATAQAASHTGGETNRVFTEDTCPSIINNNNNKANTLVCSVTPEEFHLQQNHRIQPQQQQSSTLTNNSSSTHDVPQGQTAIVGQVPGRPIVTQATVDHDDDEHKSPRESGEDSEDESEILEESPCGRWMKRREEVEQRDVPGIDCAHLAMDTEEGVEVVWNEVQFSERKNFKSQEEKIQQVFENLTQLEHPNIVKFHRYWTDTHNDKPRVIFITEYMSSGSLKQFLKRTKRNVKKLPLQAWKRWCTQILSALSYLHSCSPPIIHGNLTCDTIFIQHNGLVKIGSVAPDAIHHHVKTCRENMKNMHFIAPEYGCETTTLTPAIDIYSFGMCALEMAALEIQGNGDSGTLVTDEHIARTIDSLEDAQQMDFIRKCLNKDPAERPNARELLFHPLLFEVHCLKLLAAHCLVNTSPNFSETIIDEMMQRLYKPDVVLGSINKSNESIEYKLADVQSAEKLEKFVEDVKYGIYPLTAFAAKQPPPPRPRAISPETAESVKSVTPEPIDVETRKVVHMMCSVKPREDSCDLLMTILLRMDDKMNRQLTCQVSQDDSATLLSHELVHLGFIHDTDREQLAALIEDTLRSSYNKHVQQQQQQHQLNMQQQHLHLQQSQTQPQSQYQSSSMQHQSSTHHPQQQSLGSSTILQTGETNHNHRHHTHSHHHHLPVPVHLARIDRGWTVADSDSPMHMAGSSGGPFAPSELLLQQTIDVLKQQQQQLNFDGGASAAEDITQQQQQYPNNEDGLQSPQQQEGGVVLNNDCEQMVE